MVRAVDSVYGKADLSRDPCFAGGFINFGYWESIDIDAPLREADRVRSQEDLYRLVLAAVGVDESSRLLEVGCGRGLGCALALAEFGPAEVHGVDVHPEQVRRAKESKVDSSGRLDFWLGSASSLPFPDNSVDCLYSVEAAQHFPSLKDFVAEAARVLVPGGRFAVSTFFAVRAGLGDQLNDLLDSFASGLDVPHPLPSLLDFLVASGFSEISALPIGTQVWPGFDRWVANTKYADSWPRNFLRAYAEGLLEYYLVTAALPGAGSALPSAPGGSPPRSR
jgi:ubiquinone/menaquinone biosynthesis C-methylase UbiE